jgi:LysR family glycine cleavage system transcriptional activator
MDLARLPSLELIKGFVAVGRRMSITLAAADLGLTQSAVSRQVQTLEEQLGVRLLVRGHRRIAFTPEGERLFRSASGAVQQLQDVVGGLRGRGRLRPVTISSAVGFAGLWLLPRLGRLQKRHPRIDVRVSANNQVVDLESEGIDLAIRYTTPGRAPQGATRLFGEAVAPVAAPSLALKPLTRPDRLAGLTLLEFDDARTPWLHWQNWLDAMGWSTARAAHHLRFNQYDLVVQAALAGQGVALGRVDLIRPLIEARRLVYLARPREPSASTHAYWLVRAHAALRSEVRDVAEWIEAEAAADLASAAADGDPNLALEGA